MSLVKRHALEYVIARLHMYYHPLGKAK